MLATGLHQVPHSEVTYYWRLKDHAAFLKQIGVRFTAVQPRMSRDFLIACADARKAERAAARMQAALAPDGLPLFEVDNRGQDLFVMLTYPHDIPADFTFSIGATRYTDLHRHVAFVALKNGERNGIGYFVDSGSAAGQRTAREFPLREMPERIMNALGVNPPVEPANVTGR